MAEETLSAPWWCPECGETVTTREAVHDHLFVKHSRPPVAPSEEGAAGSRK